MNGMPAGGVPRWVTHNVLGEAVGRVKLRLLSRHMYVDTRESPPNSSAALRCTATPAQETCGHEGKAVRKRTLLQSVMGLVTVAPHPRPHELTHR